MKLKTKEPMEMSTWAMLVDKHGLYKIGKNVVRIMNASPGQEIECNSIIHDKDMRKFGLRKVEDKPYQYLAFLVE